eukprot:Skav221768  [mRNA]  locus=scaffold490:399097:418119:- [translate_table: standard]
MPGAQQGSVDFTIPGFIVLNSEWSTVELGKQRETISVHEVASQRMKNAACVAVSLLWCGVSALTVAHNATKTPACAASEAHHRNELMETYCGHTIVRGIDKSIDAKGCKALYTDQVQLALANKMFKSCDSLCLFDFDMPHLAAFRWMHSEQCWLKAETCGEPGEQDALVARRHALCEVAHGPCQPVAHQLTDEVMSSYCSSDVSGAEKFAAATGCEESYTHQVRRSLANRMFDDCSSWCLFDFDRPKHVWYAWVAKRKCWLKTGSPCGPRYAQQGAVLRRKKFCKDSDHTLSVNQEGCVPFSSQLSNRLMERHCGDLQRYTVQSVWGGVHLRLRPAPCRLVRVERQLQLLRSESRRLQEGRHRQELGTGTKVPGLRVDHHHKHYNIHNRHHYIHHEHRDKHHHGWGFQECYSRTVIRGHNLKRHLG